MMDDHDCQGASCKCMDDTTYPRRRKRWRPDSTPFSGPIGGTAGTKATRTQPRHPGDKPLSIDAQEYAAQLWRETDGSLRLDEAKHGEIKRWDWRSLGELRERDRQRNEQEREHQAQLP